MKVALRRKTVSGIMFSLLLIGMSTLAFNVQPVKASGTIYIRADGSIDPPTAFISSLDNVTYTFASNINDSIVVERNNIVVDGAGYALQGNENKKGFHLYGVSNVTIKNTEIKAFYCGVRLDYSSNNSIYGNRIANNIYGVFLNSSSNNALSGNNITDNGNSGIWLEDSSNHNSISNNNITKNGIGIQFIYSSNNSISGNIITSNHYGIELYLSSNSRLRNNVLADNDINFVVLGKALSDFINDVDPSNTADSKKIYYLINHRDFLVPSDAGFVVLVNCTNVIVKNLKPKNNIPNILLAYTQNSTITENNMTNSLDSDWAINIWLINSSGNNIYDNNIGKGRDGIYLSNSSYNNIYSNTITEITGVGGITLSKSSYNNIYANTLTNGNGISLFTSSNNLIIQNNLNLTSDRMCWINLTGPPVCGGRVMLYRSSNNVIYHNNFVMNRNLLYISDSVNIWDNGYPSGGNYWSGYDGVDSSNDGIGGSEYLIDANNRDRYPLMGMFHSFNTSLGCDVNVISNLTIEDFQYFESNSTIKMYVSGEEGLGFCRVSIPHVLMNVSSILVVIDHGLTPVLYHNYTLYDNGTHRWIYFAYEHSLHEIDIIPEFQSFVILPLFIVIALLTVIMHRRCKLTLAVTKHLVALFRLLEISKAKTKANSILMSK